MRPHQGRNRARTIALPATARARAHTADKTTAVGCRSMATPFVNPPGSQAVHATGRAGQKPTLSRASTS